MGWARFRQKPFFQAGVCGAGETLAGAAVAGSAPLCGEVEFGQAKGLSNGAPVPRCRAGLSNSTVEDETALLIALFLCPRCQAGSGTRLRVSDHPRRHLRLSMPSLDAECGINHFMFEVLLILGPGG